MLESINVIFNNIVMNISKGKIRKEDMDFATESSLSFIYSHIDDFTLLTESEHDQAKNHIAATWGSAFKAAWVAYRVGLDAVIEHYTYIKDSHSRKEIKDEEKQKYNVLVHLHGKACQMYQEILCLLEHGFPEGAVILSRSLYELCCTAIFIYNDTCVVAKAYWEYADNNDGLHNWAKASDKFSQLSDKSKIMATSIEEKCGIDDINAPEFRLFANRYVHASPSTTIKRLSIDLPNVILTGPSDRCLEISGINATTSFHLITLVTLYYLSTELSRFHVSVLSKLCWKAREDFLTAAGNDHELAMYMFDISSHFGLDE